MGSWPLKLSALQSKLVCKAAVTSGGEDSASAQLPDTTGLQDPGWDSTP